MTAKYPTQYFKTEEMEDHNDDLSKEKPMEEVATTVGLDIKV